MARRSLIFSEIDELFKNKLLTLPVLGRKGDIQLCDRFNSFFRKIEIYLTLPFVIVRKVSQKYKELTRKQKEQ